MIPPTRTPRFPLHLLLLLMLTVGCVIAQSASLQTPPTQTTGNPVSVGMAYEDAEPALSGAGGMHIDIDGIEDTDSHIREVNKFPNGTVVLIEISMESRKITNLKVCVDPNQSTGKLEWKSVKSFDPGID